MDDGKVDRVPNQAQLKIEWDKWVSTPAPFVAGSDTSEAAAKSIEPTRSKVAAKILSAFSDDADFRNGGATCDQIEESTGLSHQTASARIRDLVKSGLLMDSGVRRKTRSGRPAAVWKVVQREQSEQF